MSKLYVSANITIVAVERKTSQKGKTYLKVTVKDAYKNSMTLCDMNSANEDIYIVGAKGTMELAITSTYEHTRVSIEEFIADTNS